MSNQLNSLQLENEALKEEIKALKGHGGYSEAFSLDEYRRYGRQLIVPEIGILGRRQHKLKNASILVIGAGGLGCPALAYLAGAGVGTIGIVDDDDVEASNLHRQVLHDSSKIGMKKTQSAAEYCKRLNPHVQIDIHSTRLDGSNSFDIFSPYDLILDCTDAPAARYLINDTAVLLGKPVVSASALKTEGQLSIFNYQNGPCYRCFYPVPPPVGSVLSCGDGGIVGPVVGVMGVMQATEAIKILVGTYKNNFTPFLQLYNAFSTGNPWRYFKMRGKSNKCKVCSANSLVNKSDIENGNINYVEFCGVAPAPALSSTERVSAKEYSEIRQGEHTLIDVRPFEQFAICSLPGSINIPIDELDKKSLQHVLEPVYVICRLGNDSQTSVPIIKAASGLKEVYDVKGGLRQWSNEVDPSFPIY